MSDFGDATPEDSWDPDDPVEELLNNLVRRLIAILMLRSIDEELHQRVGMIRDDLNHILTRVHQGRLG